MVNLDLLLLCWAHEQKQKVQHRVKMLKINLSIDHKNSPIYNLIFV